MYQHEKKLVKKTSIFKIGLITGSTCHPANIGKAFTFYTDTKEWESEVVITNGLAGGGGGADKVRRKKEYSFIILCLFFLKAWENF